MNRVILTGRLTKDPDIRYSQGENPLCTARYTLAVDRYAAKNNENGDSQTADFVPCVAFRKAAEFAEKYLQKGTKIAIEGRLLTGSYTNKDGQKVYTMEVVVEKQEFAESRQSRQSSDSPATAAADEDGFMNIPEGMEDEGLPFPE